MLVMQAYRYRVYPTTEQRALFVAHSGLSRFAYNWALRKQNDWWQRNRDPETGKVLPDLKRDMTDARPNSIGLSKLWTATKENRYDENGKPWAEELIRNTVTYALKAVDDAFKHYFRRRKANDARKCGACRKYQRKLPCPHCFGYPRFKHEGKCGDSFTIQDQSFKTEKYALRCGKIGMVSTRPLEAWVQGGRKTDRIEGRALRICVSRVADRWFMTIMVEREREDPKPVQGPVAGIDLGLTSVATVMQLGDGDPKATSVAPPASLGRRLKHLKRISRRLARRDPTSQRYQETKLAIQKIHMRIADDRSDYLHQLSHKIVTENSTVVVEGYDLRPRTAAGEIRYHGRKNRRSFADNAMGELRRQLAYKGTWYGSKVHQLAKTVPSNRTCSSCGHVHEENARRDSAKIFECLSCGNQMPRQQNTAMLLARIGLGEVDAP